MQVDWETERVLVFTPSGRDGELTAQVLARQHLGAVMCDTLDQLLAALGPGASCVVVAEEALTPRAVARLAEWLRAQPPWSDLPFIVVAHRVGARARSEPLQALGNVTILDRPLKIRLLIGAVRAALRARQRQHDARRAIEQREQFLAMLGHELRNPLGSIVLATEMLKNGVLDRAARKPVEVLDRQTRHLVRLVDDLLDVSRVTSGKIALKRVPLDVGAVLRRCVEAARANGTGHRIALETAADPLVVDGDAVRLEQIFTNLLVNAMKYSPGGSEVEVAVRARDGNVEISVRDHGVGIAQDMLAAIFDLFAQAETTLDRSRGGMGVGLTVVKRLVELHGGRVEARSDGLGRGSELVVYLPLAAQAIRDEPRRSPQSPFGRLVRIVLVEDNQDIREMCRDALEQMGCHVCVADSGPAGVEHILAFNPDVALVDIGLPGLDGYEVSRRVRASGSSVRLVALTGYGLPEDQDRARAAGFDAHLTKPVTVPMLREAVAGSLG